jgi:hypothetical protein
MNLHMPSTRLLMTITNSGSTGIVFVRIERLPTEGKVTAAGAVVANSVVTLAACASRQLVTQAATHLAAGQTDFIDVGPGYPTQVISAGSSAPGRAPARCVPAAPLADR